MALPNQVIVSSGVPTMLELTLQRKHHQESWSEMGKRASLQTFLSLADGLATLRPTATQAVVVSCGRYPSSPLSRQATCPWNSGTEHSAPSPRLGWPRCSPPLFSPSRGLWKRMTLLCSPPPGIYVNSTASSLVSQVWRFLGCGQEEVTPALEPAGLS